MFRHRAHRLPIRPERRITRKFYDSELEDCEHESDMDENGNVKEDHLKLLCDNPSS